MAVDDVEVLRLTAPGSGGIAVVALRGPGRGALAARLLRSDVAVAVVPRRVTLWLAGSPADQVVALSRPEQIELHLHGSPALLSVLEREVGGLGIPVAGPAQRLAATAQSDAQLALALEQQRQAWATSLAGLVALPAGPVRSAAIEAARERSRHALALAEAQRLVLCGARNAGKSTLMNRLLFDERVLAGDQPGLTRDPVQERTVLGGHPYDVIDTAGEALAPSELELRAIDLGRRERATALCVGVVDGSVGVGGLERELAGAVPIALWVRNKADLPQAAWPEDLGPRLDLSCLDPAAAPRIRGQFGAALRRVRNLPLAGPVGGPAALDRHQWSELQALR